MVCLSFFLNWFAWLACDLYYLWYFLLVLNEPYFGLSEEHVPVIVIQSSDSQKYLKPNVEAD